MANDLQLTNVMNVSVSNPQAGLGRFNTSNIALFTRDEAAESFGTDPFKLYVEPTEVATDFGTASDTYKMALAMFAQKPNMLRGRGYLAIIPFADEDETVDEAVLRTKDLIQYFGVLAAEMVSDVDILAAAALIQTLRKIAFFPLRDPAKIEPSAIADDLATGGYSQSRALFYGSNNDTDALRFAAAYAGRALSVNFTGSNTTETMHLKDLLTILPDPTVTQTLLTKAKAAGADTYVSLQGVPKVYTSGANTFFDRVYNIVAFVAAIEIAGFNAMAQADTKLPQTEEGVSVLTGAYRKVCEQFRRNQYIAPGEWNSATTFGNIEDFVRNIGEVGYYIFSTPVALQSQAEREEREAPLAQIALKEAGAIHSASVIININA